MREVIRVENLSKSYHNRMVLQNLNFTVREGEVLAMLGPNGAGKSTVINILSTLLTFDSGNIHILGHDIKTEEMIIKHSIGIIPQELAIYENLSAERNVRFFASLYGLSGKNLDESVKNCLELVGLYGRKDDKPKTFSGGMKRRLNIACGIAHNPPIIVMDEPTVGIDPQSRNHILSVISSLKNKGVSILYSTHYMEEVETISDRIIIMNEGSVIAEGTKEGLKEQLSNEITYEFTIANITDLDEKALLSIPSVKNFCRVDNQLSVTIFKSTKGISNVIEMINQDCLIENMTRQEISLERVFLSLTGKNLKDWR